MNVRLEHQFQFTAGTYLDGKLHMNNYYLKLEMITLSVDGVEQNIALDRIRHMLFRHFQDCIFIKDDDVDAIDKFQSAEVNVVILPETPVDQIIGIMLYCKLNAIMQDRLCITQCKISSELGQNLWYLQCDEEDVGPFEELGWWHTPDPNTFEKNRNYSNIIRLQKNSSWHDYHLEWDDELLLTSDNSTVLAFGKDDEK
jgi:hypothetical protein